ncbi:DUF4089 domain-containing protein [Methylopila musalis]|uniref:DUF4089 domain-containing protein n=1 Tax=Methylopila musalis TaxID=1134781 RepID=A0ABW3Z4E6_9HYPH
MTDDTRALEAHLDAATTLLGLPLSPAWRGSVLAHLEATMRAARFVDAFPFDDVIEPAPVFAPAAREVAP